MSKYTTGEIAKLCGVSVRTVQYYDERGILIPSELSEGGRRLYNDEDLKRLHLICFLRDIGIPINGIYALLSDDNPKNIISILLEEQEIALKEQMADCRSKLDVVEAIKRELKEMDDFSVESIGDIANVMKQKSKLSQMRKTMLLTGIPVSALQLTSVVLWITNGLWWLFAIWGAVAITWGIAVSVYYFSHVAYICPECHNEFRPKFKEAFWAYHTPRMRRLECPKCAHKGLCVEVYRQKEKKNG